jgi:hypothetical protein
MPNARLSMTELDITAEVETEDFTDDLSDEALDRQERWESFSCNWFTGWATRGPA